MNINKICIFLILLNFILINSIKFGEIYRNLKEKEIPSNIFDPYEEVNLKTDNEDLFEITNYELINPDNPNYFYIPIFGSSDLHGHYYEEEFEVGNLSYSQGGLDYLGKYVNIIRNEFNNQMLYLDAGDLFQGGTESTITNGSIMLDYLNLMNADAMTLGNHEYDYDRDFIEQKVNEAKFPILATNVYDENKKTKQVFGNNHLSSKKYTFKVPNAAQEITIGVVGLTMQMTEQTISGKGYEGIDFLKYKDELVSEAQKLRNEGVKAVILLSHIGLGCGDGNNLTLNIYKPEDDQEQCSEGSDIYKLIYEIDEGTIDAVVTGHSHRAVHHFIRNIPVISPINNGLYANIIYLAFDRKNNYKIVKEQARIEGPLPICKQIFKKSLKCDFVKKSELGNYLPLVNYTFHKVKIEKEPDLQKIHEKYDEQYSVYNQKICTIIGTEDTLTVETNGSYYLGNIVADAQNYISGADVSIVSYGVLRAEWKPGRIQRYKVLDLLPFGNILCTFVMTGEEVKRMLKIIQTGHKKYYTTSGVKQLMVKTKKNEDFYLSEVKLFDGYIESDLIPNRDYKVSANDFLINGGDDFYRIRTWYEPRDLTCEYGPDLDLFEKYLKDQGVIDVRNYMDEDNPRIRFVDNSVE